MTPRTPQCEVFWALLSSSEHSGVPEDSKPLTFPSVGLHPHTWAKWGCDTLAASAIDIGVFYMCAVACLVGATELVILRTCPRSRDEIGFGPIFLNHRLSFNKAQAISVLTKRNRHAFS